jgi:hypothetical protein
MSNRCLNRDIAIWLVGLLVLAVTLSWLRVAPDFRVRAIIPLMVGLSLGPLLEHLFARTSPARWALDLILVAAAMMMIWPRLLRETRGRVVLSYLGAVLWYSLACLTWMNQSE